MAFKKEKICHFLYVLLMLIYFRIVKATNIDCGGKPFHCVNSTHFMICVDLGAGVSKTVDDFLIQCPSLTVCRGSNNFECEYQLPTTTESITRQGEEYYEFETNTYITTVAPFQETRLLGEYLNTITQLDTGTGQPSAIADTQKISTDMNNVESTRDPELFTTEVYDTKKIITTSSIKGDSTGLSKFMNKLFQKVNIQEEEMSSKNESPKKSLDTLLYDKTTERINSDSSILNSLQPYSENINYSPITPTLFDVNALTANDFLYDTTTFRDSVSEGIQDLSSNDYSSATIKNQTLTTVLNIIDQRAEEITVSSSFTENVTEVNSPTTSVEPTNASFYTSSYVNTNAAVPYFTTSNPQSTEDITVKETVQTLTVSYSINKDNNPILSDYEVRTETLREMGSISTMPTILNIPTEQATNKRTIVTGLEASDTTIKLNITQLLQDQTATEFSFTEELESAIKPVKIAASVSKEGLSTREKDNPKDISSTMPLIEDQTTLYWLGSANIPNTEKSVSEPYLINLDNPYISPTTNTNDNTSMENPTTEISLPTEVYEIWTHKTNKNENDTMILFQENTSKTNENPEIPVTNRTLESKVTKSNVIIGDIKLLSQNEMVRVENTAFLPTTEASNNMYQGYKDNINVFTNGIKVDNFLTNDQIVAMDSSRTETPNTHTDKYLVNVSNFFTTVPDIFIAPFSGKEEGPLFPQNDTDKNGYIGPKQILAPKNIEDSPFKRKKENIPGSHIEIISSKNIHSSIENTVTDQFGTLPSITYSKNNHSYATGVTNVITTSESNLYTHIFPTIEMSDSVSMLNENKENNSMAKYTDTKNDDRKLANNTHIVLPRVVLETTEFSLHNINNQIKNSNVANMNNKSTNYTANPELAKEEYSDIVSTSVPIDKITNSNSNDFISLNPLKSANDSRVNNQMNKESGDGSAVVSIEPASTDEVEISTSASFSTLSPDVVILSTEKILESNKNYEGNIHMTIDETLQTQPIPETVTLSLLASLTQASTNESIISSGSFMPVSTDVSSFSTSKSLNTINPEIATDSTSLDVVNISASNISVAINQQFPFVSTGKLLENNNDIENKSDLVISDTVKARLVEETAVHSILETSTPAPREGITFPISHTLTTMYPQNIIESTEKTFESKINIKHKLDTVTSDTGNSQNYKGTHSVLGLLAPVQTDVNDVQHVGNIFTTLNPQVADKSTEKIYEKYNNLQNKPKMVINDTQLLKEIVTQSVLESPAETESINVSSSKIFTTIYPRVADESTAKIPEKYNGIEKYPDKILTTTVNSQRVEDTLTQTVLESLSTAPREKIKVTTSNTYTTINPHEAVESTAQMYNYKNDLQNNVPVKTTESVDSQLVTDTHFIFISSTPASTDGVQFSSSNNTFTTKKQVVVTENLGNTFEYNGDFESKLDTLDDTVNSQFVMKTLAHSNLELLISPSEDSLVAVDSTAKIYNKNYNSEKNIDMVTSNTVNTQLFNEPISHYILKSLPTVSTIENTVSDSKIFATENINIANEIVKKMFEKNNDMINKPDILTNETVPDKGPSVNTILGQSSQTSIDEITLPATNIFATTNALDSVEGSSDSMRMQIKETVTHSVLESLAPASTDEFNFTGRIFTTTNPLTASKNLTKTPENEVNIVIGDTVKTQLFKETQASTDAMDEIKVSYIFTKTTPQVVSEAAKKTFQNKINFKAKIDVATSDIVNNQFTEKGVAHATMESFTSLPTDDNTFSTGNIFTITNPQVKVERINTTYDSNNMKNKISMVIGDTVNTKLVKNTITHSVFGSLLPASAGESHTTVTTNPEVKTYITEKLFEKSNNFENKEDLVMGDIVNSQLAKETRVNSILESPAATDDMKISASNSFTTTNPQIAFKNISKIFGKINNFETKNNDVAKETVIHSVLGLSSRLADELKVTANNSTVTTKLQTEYTSAGKMCKNNNSTKSMVMKPAPNNQLTNEPSIFYNDPVKFSNINQKLESNADKSSIQGAIHHIQNNISNIEMLKGTEDPVPILPTVIQEKFKRDKPLSIKSSEIISKQNDTMQITSKPKAVINKNDSFLVIYKNNEKHEQSSNVTKVPQILLKRRKPPNDTVVTKVYKDGGNKNLFVCKNRVRGRYADENNCRKFYICIGRIQPVLGECPVNTVFSEIKKQCTKNLSHCVRRNQFRCIQNGRFADVLRSNVYYICAQNKNTYVRFQLQCQNGYHLNKTSVKCVSDIKSQRMILTSVDANKDSNKASDQSTVELKSKEKKQNKDAEENVCKKEGKLPHEHDCRKYYVCSKNSKSEFRRRTKKCDSDEVFHPEKKKCVDVDSYDCD